MLLLLMSKYGDSMSFAHRNKQGDRPVDIAIRYGKSKVVEILGTD